MMTNRKIIKISRSKIELFIDCPRCFWLETRHNIKRPEIKFPLSIGSKYDSLLKRSFDEYRRKKTIPQELRELSLNFFLYPDIKRLNIWRNRGIEYYHPQHKITYYGKIDDLLISEKKELVIVDFKTTLSKGFNIYESYKRELEIYGYLLKNRGEKLLNFGILYFVRIDINEKFEKIEERKILVIDNLDYSIYDEILEELKETYYSDKEPQASQSCEFCKRDFFIKEFLKDNVT